ncbi:MAG: alkaline phosphatase family protein [Ilumatobacteraceae bacterium]
MLTGHLPREHGIVGNGWYDRELSEVMFWKQSNRLVGCEDDKLWHAGRRRFGPGFTVATMFWWFNMYPTLQRVDEPNPARLLPNRQASCRHRHRECHLQ